MYNEKMHHLGSVRSVIRELFEFGKKRAQEIGADKVSDFSLPRRTPLLGINLAYRIYPSEI